MKYEANDCENISFIQLETRTIILHSVNLRAWEIKRLSAGS